MKKILWISCFLSFNVFANQEISITNYDAINKNVIWETSMCFSNNDADVFFNSTKNKLKSKEELLKKIKNKINNISSVKTYKELDNHVFIFKYNLSQEKVSVIEKIKVFSTNNLIVLKNESVDSNGFKNEMIIYFSRNESNCTTDDVLENINGDMK